MTKGWGGERRYKSEYSSEVTQSCARRGAKRQCWWEEWREAASSLEAELWGRRRQEFGSSAGREEIQRRELTIQRMWEEIKAEEEGTQSRRDFALFTGGDSRLMAWALGRRRGWTQSDRCGRTEKLGWSETRLRENGSAFASTLLEIRAPGILSAQPK
jgi:hypothetical protein